mgnify:CR=1 FL=1
MNVWTSTSRGRSRGTADAVDSRSHSTSSDPRPCYACGGVNFTATEETRVRHGRYELTEADRVFLRVQGIDPDVR